jgi:hypothetical protein
MVVAMVLATEGGTEGGRKGVAEKERKGDV